MKIKGTIAKVYDTVSGEYLGTPYQYREVVINEPKVEGLPYSRMTFRVKGEHLERFNREGVATDGRLHTYEVIGEVKETTWEKDSTIHPQIKSLVCVGWE